MQLFRGSRRVVPLCLPFAKGNTMGASQQFMCFVFPEIITGSLVVHLVTTFALLNAEGIRQVSE